MSYDEFDSLPDSYSRLAARILFAASIGFGLWIALFICREFFGIQF